MAERQDPVRRLAHRDLVLASGAVGAYDVTLLEEIRQGARIRSDLVEDRDGDVVGLLLTGVATEGAHIHAEERLVVGAGDLRERIERVARAGDERAFVRRRALTDGGL